MLAVRVDPPESTADLSGDGPLTPSRISALVVTAAYGSSLEYGRAVQVSNYRTVISVCPPPSISDVNAQPGCPPGSEVIADLPSVPSLESPFIYTPPLELLQQARDQDPVHGLTGIQLRMQLSIYATPIATTAIPNPQTTIITTNKTLNYQLPGSLVSVNHAIELIGTEVSTNGGHEVLLPAHVVNMIVAQTTGIRPLIGPGAGASQAIETYNTYDNNGALITLTEHVTYAFYAGNALFFGTPLNGPTAIYTGAAGDVADEPAPGSPDPPDGLATAEPVFLGPQAGSFWVVARDGRGAEAWQAVPYSAIDVRPCAQMITPNAILMCPTVFFGCN